MIPPLPLLGHLSTSLTWFVGEGGIPPPILLFFVFLFFVFLFFVFLFFALSIFSGELGAAV